MMDRDVDVVIQKVLARVSTAEERDWLLDQLMKFYNQLLMLLAKKRYNQKDRTPT